MKAMSKQFLCLMLAAFMCLSLLPLPALAAGGANGNIVPAEVPEQTEAASAPTEVPGNPEVEVIAPAPEQTEASASTPEPEVEPTPTPEATESTPTPSEENLEDSVVPESPEPELKDVPETRKPAIDPMTIGQDVRPLKGGPVSAPLITVAYHYVEDVQAASPFDLAAPGISAHSYYPLAKISGDNMVIPANHFPGEIPVRTENLTVMVDGALDVTAQAEYDAATGCLYLHARYWGHEVQVDWFCS